MPGTEAPTPAVLIVEDEQRIRDGLVRAVQSQGYRAVPAAGLAEARRALTQPPTEFCCVLLDIHLRDGDGLSILREMRQGALPEAPVIVVTAYGDSERTIEAMKDGAFDYVTKPFELPALLDAVGRAVRQRTLTQQAQLVDQNAPAVQPGPAPASQLVGQSAAMLSVWKVIGRAAVSAASVLITGETGTGKELLARAIHQHSPRASEPFVAVNLAALPATLLESELFGHEKGAFTGAAARKPGRVELAGGGTLFLDEIGDLDPVLQTKLLRVLQDGRYERVGGTEPLQNRARVLAATHKPVRPGETGVILREDLYYRLAVIEIELPPLRARRSDIPLLVTHALRDTQARAVSEEAMERLLRHDWPGNVRELLHVVQRAAIMCGGEVIDVGDLPAALQEATARGGSPLGAPAADPYEGLPLREAMAKLERHLIERALQRAGGNRAEAARILGIARPQLYTKMEEHGLPTRGDTAPKAKDGERP